MIALVLAPSATLDAQCALIYATHFPCSRPNACFGGVRWCLFLSTHAHAYPPYVPCFHTHPLFMHPPLCTHLHAPTFMHPPCTYIPSPHPPQLPAHQVLHRSCCGLLAVTPVHAPCKIKTSTSGMAMDPVHTWTVLASPIGKRGIWGQCMDFNGVTLGQSTATCMLIILVGGWVGCVVWHVLVCCDVLVGCDVLVVRLCSVFLFCNMCGCVHGQSVVYTPS